MGRLIAQKSSPSPQKKVHMLRLNFQLFDTNNFFLRLFLAKLVAGVYFFSRLHIYSILRKICLRLIPELIIIKTKLHSYSTIIACSFIKLQIDVIFIHIIYLKCR